MKEINNDRNGGLKRKERRRRRMRRSITAGITGNIRTKKKKKTGTQTYERNR